MLPANVDFDTGGIWNCEIYYVNMHDFIGLPWGNTKIGKRNNKFSI